MAFMLKINGTPHEVDVDGDTPLLWVLRDVLGMTGTKFGCGQALCGACTVHVDGAATRTCITTVDSIGESAITTIEAIGQTPQGAALQKAWLELEVVRCGYCQSGQIMSAAALLKDTPKPTDDDIDAAILMFASVTPELSRLAFNGRQRAIGASHHPASGRNAPMNL